MPQPRKITSLLITSKRRIVVITLLGALLGAAKVAFIRFLVAPVLRFPDDWYTAAALDALLVAAVVAGILTTFYRRRHEVMEVSNAIRNDLQKVVYAQFLEKSGENDGIIKESVLGILAKLDVLGAGRKFPRNVVIDERRRITVKPVTVIGDGSGSPKNR